MINTRNSAIILKRDFKAHIRSFVAYGIFAIFLFFCGFFFTSNLSYFSSLSNQAAKNAYLQGEGLNITRVVFSVYILNSCVMLLLMVPLLTMKSFAEEKRSGTLELLLTLPIRSVDIVIGKFFAVLINISLLIIPLMLHPVIVSVMGGSFEAGIVFSSFVGLFLVGMAFSSLGVFVSSFSVNQTVSALITLGCLLFFWMTGWLATLVPPVFGKILAGISIIEHFRNFTVGIIDSKDILFFLLFTGFFLVLTVKSVETRR